MRSWANHPTPLLAHDIIKLYAIMTNIVLGRKVQNFIIIIILKEIEIHLTPSESKNRTA
jgi:hypothetical protein